MLSEEACRGLFDKWIGILRLQNQWDIRLEPVNDPAFSKTGDIKIDCDDRKAVVMLNMRNPRQENPEEVVVHELLHLKLYPLDQLTEGLIQGHYEPETPAFQVMETQFMTLLEQTVEELAKCFLTAFGENKNLSYGRCRGMAGLNERYEGLKPLK